MTARILIGKVDVTEHIAAMFDALVDALGWGSGFLDVETMESVLIVADLAGFKTTGDVRLEPDEVPGLVLPAPPVHPGGGEMPDGGWPSDRPEVYDEAMRIRNEWAATCRAAFTEQLRLKAEAVAAWRAQVQAKARAMAGGER